MGSPYSLGGAYPNSLLFLIVAKHKIILFTSIEIDRFIELYFPRL